MNEIGPALPQQPEPGPSDQTSRSTRADWTKGRSRRRILLTVMLLAAAIGVAIGLTELRPFPTPGDATRTAQANHVVPLVTTALLERRPMVRSLPVAGSLVARRELPIGAAASGSRIDAVLVEEGDYVAKGQVLARLDGAVLEAQLRRAQAAVQAAAAAAASAEAEFRRVDGIRGTGAVSAEQVDQRRAAAASAAARLAAAQAETSEIEARLDQMVVRAPADGVIAARNAEPGAIVSPGTPTLFQLIEGGLVEFDAQVPQDQLQRLAPGLEAEINLGSQESPAGDVRITGHIRAIAPTLDPQTRLGIVHISLPLDQRLRPGVFVQGRIVLSRSPVLSVPLSSLLRESDRSFVYVATGSHAQRRAVQTGIAEAGRVEIRSGLAEGDHVILFAGAFLHDGAAVRQVLTKPADASDGIGPE
jgi:HlyD family secretion protein